MLYVQYIYMYLYYTEHNTYIPILYIRLYVLILIVYLQYVGSDLPHPGAPLAFATVQCGEQPQGTGRERSF